MPSDDFSELILRFQAPLGDGRYPVEAWVDGLGLCVGKPVALSSETLDECTTAVEYGSVLWSTLLGALPDLNGLIYLAGVPQRVRLRILLTEDGWATGLHRIKWELLNPSGHLPAGVSPECLISRFLPLRSTIGTQPGEFGLKILLAIANPTDLKAPLEPIKVSEEVEWLFQALEPEIRAKQIQLTVLPGTTALDGNLIQKLKAANCDIVENTATTVNAIDKNLEGKHALHLIAHGNFSDDKSILVLENSAGKQDAVNPKGSVVIDQWAFHKPRLVFLQSCLSDPADKTLPLGGLATQLLQAGIPAVVAMRDLVAMGAARTFAASFYRQLLVTGDVDVAANAGRNAIYQARGSDWAIPVLYSRLRASERLWQPEPLRRSIHSLAKAWENMRAVKEPFPVEVSVVRDIKVVRKQLEDPTSDTRVDAFQTALTELKSDAKGNRLVVLVGGRGRAKSSMMQCVFIRLARDADPGGQGHQPLMVQLKDCRNSWNRAAAIEAGWEAMLATENISLVPGSIRGALESRALHLLVDADEDIGPEQMRKGLKWIHEFLDTKEENRYALISMDQSDFKPEYFQEESTTVLIVQDLRTQTLTKFLDGKLYNGEIDDETARILTTSLRDLAGVPWILSRILQMSSMSKTNLRSRFRVLERILADQLDSISIAPGCGLLARNMMENIAWHLHSRSARNLQLGETYSFLNQTRGNRDFSLDQFRRSMIDSRLLAESGPEGVRFAYNAAHAFFTACHLARLENEDRKEKLRQIVAGLGRPERLRRWQEVLLLLAGCMEDPSELLEMLLELGFGEGEHLLLAARCLSEAKAAGKKIDDDIVSQLTDSLIWWSHPQSRIPARSRQKAVDALGYMLSDDSEKELDRNELRIVGHLLQLSLFPMRAAVEGGPTGKRLDYSGVRLEAMSILFRNQALTSCYWNKREENTPFKNQVNSLLQAWTDGDLKGLKAFLYSGEDEITLAGVAAFALASWQGQQSWGSKEWSLALKERFFHFPVFEDVHWAISDALIEMQPSMALEIVSEALEGWNRSLGVTAPATKTEDLSGTITDGEIHHKLGYYVVYIIGKLGGVTAITNDRLECKYIKTCLKSTNILMQGRALRALAEVLENTLEGAKESQLLTACHDILEDRLTEAQRGMGVDPPRRLSPSDRNQLTRFALDAMNHIGNKTSIKILRDFYRRPTNSRPDPYDEMLRKTSWEMADKIRLRTQSQPQSASEV